MDIKMIGLGGIGSWLVRPLLQFLAYHDPAATVTLFDGDKYEEGNRSRQIFHRLGNKAEITAETMGANFPGLLITAVAEDITSDNAPALIYNQDIVFLCVDNHTTRRVVSEYASTLSDITVVSGGNNFTDGTVQVFVRRNNENLTLPLGNEFHPEITTAPLSRLERNACMEQAPSEPQLVVTNNMTAAIMLNCFYGLLQGPLKFDEIYFDIVSGKCRTIDRIDRKE